MTGAPTTTLDDPALMSRVVSGDMRAFEAIYDRHSAQAFGLALRVTRSRRAAEEVTQDAFVSLWRTAASYDVTRGPLNAWLLSVVRNRSVDWLRRETRHDRNVDIAEAAWPELEAAERTEEEVAAREQARHTRQLLAGLPDEQRQVVELAYFKGLTHRQIAARVNVPVGTVKGRLRLALSKLHRALVAPAVDLTDRRMA